MLIGRTRIVSGFPLFIAYIFPILNFHRKTIITTFRQSATVRIEWTIRSDQLVVIYGYKTSCSISLLQCIFISFKHIPLDFIYEWQDTPISYIYHFRVILQFKFIAIIRKTNPHVFLTKDKSQGFFSHLVPRFLIHLNCIFPYPYSVCLDVRSLEFVVWVFMKSFVSL